jgi:hypothetical protein
VSGVLNSRWKVYTDPTFESEQHFYIGQKVVWGGGKKRGKCLGIVVDVWFPSPHRDGTKKYYIVKVLHRPHGGQRTRRLYAHEMTLATIVDEIAALGRTDSGGDGAEVQDR